MSLYTQYVYSNIYKLRYTCTKTKPSLPTPSMQNIDHINRFPFKLFTLMNAYNMKPKGYRYNHVIYRYIYPPK